MAWNEPGGGRDRDPWGNRGRGSGGGPPDLDQVWRKIQAWFKGLFGGKGGAPQQPSGGTGGGRTIAAGAVLALVAGIYLAWDCFYAVKAGEQGVVLRLGAYVATLDPGLNLRWPRPIERVEVIHIEQIKSRSHKDSMLTQDENIVDVDVAVQYRIKSVKDYVFNVVDPDNTLGQAMESAVRSVVGENKMDFVLTEGRAAVSVQIQDMMQEILDRYKTGLVITLANMQEAKAPEEVKSAFDDAIKAREDQQRLINEAEAYRNGIIPRARGNAARQVEDAKAYKARMIGQALGDSSRFSQLLSAYEQAPEITRERLYLETVESVLAASPKVLLDSTGGNNLVYLPLEQLFGRKHEVAAPVAPPADRPHTQSASPAATGSELSARRDGREREAR
ncbi:MAG: FtsH protease activity modulator HflK [Gammaproteobacteria bacterium]